MKRLKHMFFAVVIAALFAGLAAAQDAPPADQGQGPQGPPMGGPMHMRPGMGPIPHGMGPGGRGMGKWWKNSEVVQKLGLSDAQVQQIEKVFQDHRTQLIDLRATLQKEEVKLEPLIEADQPNEAQVTSQIDRVAQARANLEKSNALMLLGIRRVLSVDQWKQLQGLHGMGPGRPHRGFGQTPGPAK